MHRSTFRRAALATAVLTLMILPAGPAFAHGDAHQGDLEMTIGFAEEPAFVGLPNAVSLDLVHDGEPVTDLKPGAMKVEVTFGDETSEPMDMAPWFFFEGGELVYGEPGQYRANFVPSQAGDYTFHFMGTVDGEEVDQEMTSSSKTFSSVETLNESAFPPVDTPSVDELATRVDEESARAQESVVAAQEEAASANDAASSARTIGIIGVILGAIGVIAAIIAITRRKA